jgi:hypothetical protein
MKTLEYQIESYSGLKFNFHSIYSGGDFSGAYFLVVTPLQAKKKRVLPLLLYNSGHSSFLYKKCTCGTLVSRSEILHPQKPWELNLYNGIIQPSTDTRAGVKIRYEVPGGYSPMLLKRILDSYIFQLIY